MTAVKNRRGMIISAVIITAVYAAVFAAEQTLPSTSMVFTVLKKGAVYALAAVAMNLLVGFTGIFSLGHAGFMLIGAYVYGVLTIPPALRMSVYQYFNGGIIQFEMPFFIAIILAVLVYFLLWRTSFGFKMRAAGASARAARYGGIAVGTCLVAAMVISGGLAGLAGAIEVMGVHHRAIGGITSGYGFSGIVVALFGGLHPAGIIPAAFFFGLLLVGGNMTQNAVGVPANMVSVLQGVIILVIVATQMVLSNKYLMERVWRHFQKEQAA